MSRCISIEGEYSAHKFDPSDRCNRCRVWTCPKCDEDEAYPNDATTHECAPKSPLDAEDNCPSCGCVYFAKRTMIWCRDGRCDCHSETEGADRG